MSVTQNPARRVSLGRGGLDFGVVYRENIGAVSAFFARRCTEPEQVADRMLGRLHGQLTLGPDEIEDLLERIDAQRQARAVLADAVQLPELERAAMELVDLAGMTPTDAARALNVSPGTLRVRLFRARRQLRKQQARH